MAHAVKTDSKGTYVVVVKKDTLSGIAAEFKGQYGVTSWQQLSTINKSLGTLSDPNKIYVGQKIYLKATSSGSSSGTSTNSNAPKITAFGIDSMSDKTLFATWTWSGKPIKETASYKVLWTYENGSVDKNGKTVWFVGDDGTISVDQNTESASRQDTFNVPSGAKQVKFKVRPIAITVSKKSGDTTKQVEKWQADWSSTETWTNQTPLEKPGKPSVELEQLSLTASLSNINITGATGIEFQLVKNNDEKQTSSKKIEITAGFASHRFTVVADAEYKVRCRAYAGGLYSDWSEYSDSKETRPATPSGISQIKAASTSSVYLKWGASKTADSYEIEYTTKKEYFDKSGETQITPVSKDEYGVLPNEWTVTGLQSGSEYFFRVRAKKGEEASPWTDIKSVVVGRTPAAPTTWSSTTTATMEESVTLYWVHNSQDGSSWDKAKIEMIFYNAADSVLSIEIPEVDNTNKDDPFTEEEDESNKTGEYKLTFTDYEFYKDIKTVKWRVCTRGITKVDGEYSTPRTITVNERPYFEELSIYSNDPSVTTDNTMISDITTLPFYVYAVPGPRTQAPISYHLTITANDTYETSDNFGNDTVVSAGDIVYSKYFDIRHELLVKMSANNIDLENGMRYTLTCTVSMDSGLTATSSLEFGVDWVEPVYAPNAEIGIDLETYTASIRPYCEDRYLINYKVEKNGTRYTLTDERLGELYGEPVSRAIISVDQDSYQVYSGVTAEGVDVYFCTIEASTLVTNVYMDVYRREFDGSFTEIATDLDGENMTTVTDPHPALDYARYRVVSRHKETGAVNYYDLPGRYIGCPEIIIQWDEVWTPFDVVEDAFLEQPSWTGSVLRLPYNIDVSDNTSPEVELVKYAGRQHPVSYYGTQLGHSATWSTVIEKDNVETIYALRRLAKWAGNVYVREPSGTGYWANITVNFSQKHLDKTIPVSFSITRVEGGA